MRVRQGFVSNSSSSSFIIGIKDFKKIEVTPEWVGKMLESLYSSILNPEHKITNIKELDEYTIDRYGWKDQTVEQVIKEEGLEEQYESIKTAINNGYMVSALSVDYDEESMTNFLEALPDVDDGNGIYKISGEN